MGNPLLKNYNMDKTPFTQGGFKDLWDIYHGTRKDRNQEVCIFILEKKNLDIYTREEKEEILTILKKESSALAKFKHPLVLGLVDPIIEDKSSLMFVTEPFQYTLGKFAKSSDVSKLEIKLLILELCNVISFMHNDAKVIITALTPESILITQSGQLKLSGLAFSIPDPPLTGADLKLNTAFPNAMPYLKFIAPEIIYQNKINYQSDIFSLGLLINYLFKLNTSEEDRELIPVGNNKNNIENYKSSYEKFDSKISRLKFDTDDNDIITKSLNKSIEYRPNIRELMELQWFNDPKLKAFRFIENLESNDPLKNTEFLNKFSNILNIFELKIIEKRFLPSFLKALKNENLIVSILPIIFNICQLPGIKTDFEAAIWPSLKTVFTMKQIPAAALYFILSKLNLIAEKISNSEFSSNMLNIICKALDCGVSKIQSVVMENLAFIIKKIDSLAFKNQVFPRLVNIVLNTTSNSLKITILKSFTNVYSLLDQNIINESLLNTLEKIRKSDNTGEICVCLVKIYEEIAKVVSVESIANKIMPNLISILVGGNISKKCFEDIMNLIQKYLNRIKDSREKDLNNDEIKDKNNSDLMSNNSPIPSGNANKSENNEFGFLDSFFGGSSSNKTSSSNFNNNIPNIEKTNNFDLDFIAKSLDEATKSNKSPTFNFGGEPVKEKSIFDGIEDKNSSNQNKNKFVLNPAQENKFKINKPTNSSNTSNNIINNNINKGNSNFSMTTQNNNSQNKSDLAGFNFDMPNNRNTNTGGMNFNNNKNPNNNILDSLLSDLPQVNSGNTNNFTNNSNTKAPNDIGYNNQNNNFGNNNKNNLNLNDEYDLDFLKPNNQNKNNKTNSNINNNFNFSNNMSNNNAKNNSLNNFDFTGLNINNTNNNNFADINFNNPNNQVNNNLGNMFNIQNNQNNLNYNNNQNANSNINSNMYNFSNNFGNNINNSNNSNNNQNQNKKPDNLFDGLLNL